MNEEQFVNWCHRWRDILVRDVFRRVAGCTWPIAEEAVQESLLILWREWETRAPPHDSACYAFLRVTASRLAWRDVQREQRYQPLTGDGAAWPAGELGSLTPTTVENLARLCREAFSRLDEDFQDVLRTKYGIINGYQPEHSTADGGDE